MIGILTRQHVQPFDHIVFLAPSQRGLALHHDMAQDVGHLLVGASALLARVALGAEALPDRVRLAIGMRFIAVEGHIVLVGLAPGVERLPIHEPVVFKRLQR